MISLFKIRAKFYLRNKSFIFFIIILFLPLSFISLYFIYQSYKEKNKYSSSININYSNLLNPLKNHLFNKSKILKNTNKNNGTKDNSINNIYKIYNINFIQLFLSNSNKKIKYIKILDQLNEHNEIIEEFYSLFGIIIDLSIPLLISVSFLLFDFLFNYRIITEKEKKLNIPLNSLGISRYKNFVSFIILYIIIIFIPFIISNIFLFQYNFLLNINMLLFILHLLSVSFCLTTFISSIDIFMVIFRIYNFYSIIIGICLYLGPRFYINYFLQPFFPSINFYFVIYNCLFLKSYSTFKIDLNNPKFELLLSFLLYIVGIVFYFLMGIFCKCQHKKKYSIGEEESSPIENIEKNHQQISSINQLNKNQNNYLNIVNITKNFKSKRVLNNFNLELFNNEIFCLLGLNGSGKTTLINILSGSMNPYEGDIFFNQRSLIDDKNYLYNNISLCMEENIFFDYLTVKEHFKYIFEIVNNKEKESQIEELIEHLGLKEKYNFLCDNLSFEEKRKLCVLTALIRDSKIILLDNPTFGLDVFAKKKLLDYLKNHKKNKIILIATNSLDEAEYLGDRIGILSEGCLICSGTSSYLKSKYSNGFNINILSNKNLFTQKNKQIFLKKLNKFDKQLKILFKSSEILSIKIQENNLKIAEILDYIEKIRPDFGIKDFTINTESLEDVFLNINNKIKIFQDLIIEQIKLTGLNISNEEKIIVNSSFFLQLYSQIKRNFLPFWRNKFIFILDIFFSLLFIYLFIIVFLIVYYDSQKEQDEKIIYQQKISVIFLSSIYSCISFIFILEKIMREKIKERVLKIKHLLYLSGCNMWSYWLGFFIVDFIKLTIFSLFLLIPLSLIICTKYLFLDMIMICASSLIFIYFISLVCDKEIFGLIILFSSIIIIIIFNIIVLLIKENDIFIYIFKSILNHFDYTPISSMLISFTRLMLSMWNEENEWGDKNNLFLTSVDYIRYSSLSKFLNLIFYGIILLFYESGYFSSMIDNIKFRSCFRKINSFDLEGSILQKSPLVSDNNEIEMDSYQETLDLMNNLENNNNSNNLKLFEQNNINLYNPYVIKEIEKVSNSGELSTKIIGLNKTYTKCFCCKKVKAINNLYLFLDVNEKFGLLGDNGSGKTILLKTIINEISYDSGKIYLFGNDNRQKFNKIRTKIGYCPQIPPLFDYIKVKEIIHFYLNLKEYDEDIESISKKFDLDEYLDIYCKNLSQGNKKKLMVAIALMNYPKLLLLDEPAAGIDPISKSLIWKNISNLSSNGNIFNMILTTNSIRDAEILCDRISWFKSGNFALIDNPENIKLQYSSGYKLHIKFDEAYFYYNENSNCPNTDLTQDLLNNINNLINFENYPQFLIEYPNINYYLQILIEVINKIKQFTNKISLDIIGKDLSFEFKIELKKDQKKNLYIEIINIKKQYEVISGIDFDYESLDKIINSFIKN